MSLFNHPFDPAHEAALVEADLAPGSAAKGCLGAVQCGGGFMARKTIRSVEEFVSQLPP